MRVFRNIVIWLALAVLVGTSFSQQKSPQPSRASKPLLPAEFGGWQVSGTPRMSTDPGVADPVNAALLKEYGFNDFVSADYVRDDGYKLAVKAARFADASGAYGAFTYYKMPQMLVEKIGDQAASLNQRVLFYRGNILVDAVFQQLTAMSAAELRELSSDLPLPPGNTANLPGLPAYLPKQEYVKNSAKYILGPIALEKTGAPVPASLVGFNLGAEVVTGNYTTPHGEAALTLISYPTPQIAAEHLRQIDAARLQPPHDGPVVFQTPVFDKRTGPIVVVATGPLSESEGKSLLESVNYDANVTWNENTFFTRKDNVGNLIWNALLLCGILMGFALVIGLAFGGARVLFSRLLGARRSAEGEDVEFISLHLADGEEIDVISVRLAEKAAVDPPGAR